MGNRVRRLARRVLLFAVPAAAAYYLLLGGEYSAFDLRELAETRRETLRRVDSLQAVVDSLAIRGDSLETDTLAIERVAREWYGFVRDGERLYRFVADDGSREAEPAGGTGGTAEAEPAGPPGVDGTGGER